MTNGEQKHDDAGGWAAGEEEEAGYFAVEVSPLSFLD